MLNECFQQLSKNQVNLNNSIESDLDVRDTFQNTPACRCSLSQFRLHLSARGIAVDSECSKRYSIVRRGGWNATSGKAKVPKMRRPAYQSEASETCHTTRRHSQGYVPNIPDLPRNSWAARLKPVWKKLVHGVGKIIENGLVELGGVRSRIGARRRVYATSHVAFGPS